MTPGEQEPTRSLARLPRLTLFAIRLVRQAATRLFAASVAGPVMIGIVARAASPAPSNPDQLNDLAHLIAELVAERLAGGTASSPIDATEAGQLLNVNASWVLAEARANRISHVRLGQYVRFEPDELIGTPGTRAKAGLVRRELAPTQAFMRWWSPIAAKRSPGLALSYLWRPVHPACRLPAAVREVRRVRSAEARRPRP